MKYHVIDWVSNKNLELHSFPSVQKYSRLLLFLIGNHFPLKIFKFFMVPLLRFPLC